jgi:hypothetical protein
MSISRVRHPRSIVILALVTITLLVSSSMVGAEHIARAQNSVAVSTATWRAVATPENTSPSNQSLVLAWTVNQGMAHQFFDIVNVGTLAITSQTFRLTNILTNGGNSKAPLVTFTACLNGTWTAVDVCTGTAVELGSTATDSFDTVNTPVDVGGRIHVQATTTPRGTSSYTTTVSIAISSDQIRPGTTISS